MKRSLVQTGSSLAVTLPIDVVQAFGLKKGQEVDVSVDPATGAVVIRPGVAFVDDGRIGDQFKALAEEILARREGLLRKRR
jgi:antitoxin component of MazEF toxin-antitoxin module